MRTVLNGSDGQGVGRGRSGGRRPRPPQESLPSAGALQAEIRAIVVHLSAVALAYPREYELGLIAPGGSGVHVSGTVEVDATRAAWGDSANRNQRAKCEAAIKQIRAAARAAALAERILGQAAEQPRELADDAAVSGKDFNSALARKEHHRREQELRT